jgi:hypothetical protein
MKKLLLSISTFILFGSVFAQNSGSVKVPIIGTMPSKQYVAPFTGDEIPIGNPNQTVAPVHSSNKNGNPSIASPVNIGNTTYDLQTNAAVANRIYHKSVGVAGTWTYSVSNNLAAPDRGTGYNFNSGSGWGPLPSVRVETDRRGWPEIDYSEGGGFECFVSHSGDTAQAANGIKFVKRSPAGSGPWTESQLPPADDDNSHIIFLWPRLRIGGANNNIIHEIDISLPKANMGKIYHGMNGVLTYSRSQDGGLTWDIRHMILPGIDSTVYSGMNGDAYAIDVNGSTVAITAGGFFYDWAMWKSTSNGDSGTWTKTIIRQFPFVAFDPTVVGNMTDVDGDGVADQVPCIDGSTAILVDNNGLVHCFAGDMGMTDSGLDSLYSYAPGSDGLLYWNETMGPIPATIPAIAFAPDVNGDGMLTFIDSTHLGTYQTGLTTMPSVGVDANNNIYVSYTTLMEGTSSGTTNPQSFRDIWAIASQDGGTTWNAPYNFTNSIFDEEVFPSMARNVVGNCFDILWQQDGEPGLAVRGDMDAYGSNAIMVDCIPLDSLLTTGIHAIQNSNSQISLSPNPAADYSLLSFTTNKPGTIEINVTNMTGQRVSQIRQYVNAGNQSIRINTSKFSKGIYSVNSKIDGKVFTNKLVIK